MNTYYATDGNVRYKRVNKTVARKHYEAGQPVVLCPCNLYPFGGFRPSLMVQRDEEREAEAATFGQQQAGFDKVVSEFVSYNCQLNETGYYASYWIKG